MNRGGGCIGNALSIKLHPTTTRTRACWICQCNQAAAAAVAESYFRKILELFVVHEGAPSEMECCDVRRMENGRHARIISDERRESLSNFETFRTCLALLRVRFENEWMNERKQCNQMNANEMEFRVLCALLLICSHRKNSWFRFESKRWKEFDFRAKLECRGRACGVCLLTSSKNWCVRRCDEFNKSQRWMSRAEGNSSTIQRNSSKLLLFIQPINHPSKRQNYLLFLLKSCRHSRLL